MDDITFADAPAAHRFELNKGGHVAAYAEYKMTQVMVTFTHTEVLPGYEGQGLGSRLAKFALDAARSRGLAVVPRCPFIAGYIRKHSEYLELVGAEHRALLDA